MKIVATVLSNSRQEIISDAVASARPLVDAFLLIDTGITDDTLVRARAAAGARHQVHVVRYEGEKSMGLMRQFALEQAHALGFDWAVTLDTDERLHGSTLFRQILELTDAEVLYAWSPSDGYPKERCFRLPAKGTWFGSTHEEFRAERIETIPEEHLQFSELPKSSKELRARLLADLKGLETQAKHDAKNDRWRFYLGVTQKNLGQHQAAVAAFRSCISMRGRYAASACAQAAECLVQMNRFEEAITQALVGVAHDSGLAELYWLAAVASMCLERFEQARCFCLAAKGIGFQTRAMFRHAPMWDGELVRVYNDACRALRTARAPEGSPSA